MSAVLLNPYRFAAAGGGGLLAEYLADDAKIAWMMQESSGTVATDSSVYSQHGTYSGTPAFGQAPVTTSGSSVLFSGDDTITLAGYNGLASPQWALEVWVTHTEGFLDFCYHSGGAGTGGFGCYTDAGSFKFSGLTSPASNDGLAHQVVLEQDATHVRIYIDGVQTNSAVSAPPGTATQDGPFRFSVTAQWGTQWRGKAQALGYFHAPLGAARVAAHYAAGTA